MWLQIFIYISMCPGEKSMDNTVQEVILCHNKVQASEIRENSWLQPQTDSKGIRLNKEMILIFSTKLIFCFTISPKKTETNAVPTDVSTFFLNLELSYNYITAFLF